jgi:hypothetical protein
MRTGGVNVPDNFRVKGTKVKIDRNKHSHNYEIGKIYEVSIVDTDGTFKAKNTDTGSEGNWLRWTEVSLASEVSCCSVSGLRMCVCVRSGQFVDWV